MKFFLDTADIAKIREVVGWGILDGVTTNPTLIAKEKKDFRSVIRELCDIVPGDVNAEVLATDMDGILKEARELAQFHNKIVVKIPLTREGVKAGKVLSQENIRLNYTLIFSANQALIAAKIGARFVTPFVGRLDSVGHNGMELIQQIRAIIDNYKFSMEIVVGSIRHPAHVLESALLGADIATMPYATMENLFQHPMTDLGLSAFLKDWQDFQNSMKKS